ncbi:MAG: hypothetical protein EXS36_02315 [Pedosphaera sp.]|nr:hypothetical protein [Pedosphaera sp.]
MSALSSFLLQNANTPRVFIAATRQNDGKTTTSLGLLSALQQRYGRVGYIKPVGQRFVEIDEQKIDEDSVLMDQIFRLNCPLGAMNPIAVEPDFTRRYLQTLNYEALVARIQKAFDRVAWEKDFVLCEGTGHAGVGSVFDLSNAAVARLLNARVVIVTQGGIGKPVDEVAINHALFKKEGTEVIGVIVNKVLPEKMDYIREFVGRGLKRQGLPLLGVIPYQPMLSSPTLNLIHEELKADLLNHTTQGNNIMDRFVLGAMAPSRALQLLNSGVLFVTPGDRDDLLLAVAAHAREKPNCLAGLVLSDDLLPANSVLEQLRQVPFPVLSARDDSYGVASKVHDLIVKIRPGDTGKINIVRDLVARHVNLDQILASL